MRQKKSPVLAMILAWLSLFLLPGRLVAEQAPPADQPPAAPGRDAPRWDKGDGQRKPPELRHMGNGLIKLGDILINKRIGTVSVTGTVNMQEGLVEYLACTPKGKLHESVLSIDVDPYFLQIALLLADFQPGDRPIKAQGDTATPVGEPVTISVSWNVPDNKLHQYRAEQLVLDQKSGAAFPETDWVFTGSQMLNGQFMASVEQSLVAIYHDPFALFDHTLDAGADDTRFFANKDVLPPKGTQVSVTFKKAKMPVAAPSSPPGKPGMHHPAMDRPAGQPVPPAPHP